MCGISCIINRNNGAVGHAQIKRQTDLVIHRGPDDVGYYFGPNFAFGHRRLAILDLSPTGHQPMTFMEKYVLIHNGEIYNYVELKKELEKQGYAFHSTSDTEVILAAYDRWGTDCVNRFNGMWAFALYDSEKQIIFCSRDRYGIKPFYYADVNNKFVIGSEIKQLLPHFRKRCVNERVLVCFLVTRHQGHTEDTFFEGIRKLPGSHNLTYDLKKHTYRIDRYYSIGIDANVQKLSDKEAIRYFGDQLYRAVAIRLRSDVKIGTCLSGGLDSSSIATIASEIYRKSAVELFNGITAKSIEAKLDESRFAKMVADNAMLKWNVVTPSTQDFVDAVDEVIYTQEEPFNGPSVYMQYFVFKMAKSIGCIVMLDGQGGDETLLGYEKYLPAAYLDFYRTNGIRKTIWEIYKTTRNNHNMPLKSIAVYSVGSLFSDLRKREHMRRCSFLKSKNYGYYDILNELADAYFNVKDVQTIEIERTTLPNLLRYEDKNSMWHSIESRLPFLDYQTLESAISLHTSLKVKDGWSKYVLRRVMQDKMPEKIVWRKNKLSFTAPEAVWIHSHYDSMVQSIRQSELLTHFVDLDKLESKYHCLDKKLQWRIFNIAKWEKLFEVTV